MKADFVELHNSQQHVSDSPNTFTVEHIMMDNNAKLMVSINGVTLWYSNGKYYQQSLDSDMGVIVNIESLLFN